MNREYDRVYVGVSVMNSHLGSERTKSFIVEATDEDAPVDVESFLRFFKWAVCQDRAGFAQASQLPRDDEHACQFGRAVCRYGRKDS